MKKEKTFKELTNEKLEQTIGGGDLYKQKLKSLP